MPEYAYNLISQAPYAYWKSWPAYIYWGEDIGSSDGYACYQHSVILEDNLTYPLVLETHPNWTETGYGHMEYIIGTYYDVYIPTDGATFEAEIGFINGPASTDGATFEMGYRDAIEVGTFPMTSYHYVYNSCGERTVAYDGHLDYFEVDLSHLAGQTKNIYIRVNAGDTSTWDRAVWVDAKIIR